MVRDSHHVKTSTDVRSPIAPETQGECCIENTGSTNTSITHTYPDVVSWNVADLVPLAAGEWAHFPEREATLFKNFISTLAPGVS